MTNTNDSIAHWTRQLAGLRAQAVKRGRQAPCSDLTDNALTMCDSLLRDLAGSHLESDRLRAEVRASDAVWEHLFDTMPVACLLTDGAGFILNANRAAGVLLSLSSKRLKERELVVFSEDRAAFAALVHRLGRSGDDDLRTTLTFRPRERRPAAMDVLIKPLMGRPGLWLWFLTPATKLQAATPPQSSRADMLPAAS